MKPLTTSVYTFSKLIESGYLYVDKTAGIHSLVNDIGGQFFLSRPRRFGKSLLISTLKAIFQGRRELFDGLAIAKTDYDWQTYPVIHLDLGTAAATTPEELEQHLLRKVRYAADEHGIALDSPTASACFEDLILKVAGNTGGVVILVDEYDKPLLGHLGNPSVTEFQRILKAFYAVIKTTEAHQRFALLTGVSKFSKVSVFSDLNNLTDLTMSRRAATLLGYTQAELETNFPDYIDALAAANEATREATLSELRDWYNGYLFHQDAETVYNPVSVMKCLYERDFRNYWFETGTPTFLIELLRDKPANLGNLTAAETDFSTYEPNNLEPLPLLVQTGYLTIEQVEDFGGTRLFRLAYPNREIEQSFSRWLAQDFSRIPGTDLTNALRRLVDALNDGRPNDMLETLKLFFAKVPNDITIANEKYYQTIFFTVFKLIGTVVEAETRTNVGRIDAVVKTERDVFVFEFKLHDTAEAAMRQIREKRYFERYLDDGRPITLVGAAFDEEERNIREWLIEPAV